MTSPKSFILVGLLIIFLSTFLFLPPAPSVPQTNTTLSASINKNQAKESKKSLFIQSLAQRVIGLQYSL